MTSTFDRNSQLVKLIQKNPGIKFREIMRFTGMKNGVLSHYLGKLEQDRTVQVHRSTRQTRFYPLTITEEESKVIKALRRQTPRDILKVLILNENLQFSEIVKQVKKAPSTVSLYLSQLLEDEIVKLQYIDRKKSYQIKDRYLLDKLIEEYHPGILEKPTDNFEDIINSL